MKKLLLAILGAGPLCFLAAPAWAQITTCPAAGNAQAGCNFIITITAPGPGGVSTAPGAATTKIDFLLSSDPTSPDDVMVGIQNNSGAEIFSLTLTSTAPIFGFDGDGACSGYTMPPALAPSPCTPGFNEYFPTMAQDNGVNIIDGGVNGTQTSGTIFFTNGLQPGQFAYISLENFGTISQAVAMTPEPGTLAMFGPALLGVAGFLWRRRFPSAN